MFIRLAAPGGRHRPRTFALTLLVAAALLAVVPPRPSAAQSLEGYRATLQAAERELAAGQPDFEAVASRLRAVGDVTLPDGSTVTPDLAPIVADLEVRPPDVAAARARLEAVVEALDRPAPAAPGNARAALGAVLAQPQFAPAQAAPPSLLDRARQALAAWLDATAGRALRWLLGRTQGGAAGAVLGVVAAIAGLAVVAGLLVVGFLLVRRLVGVSDLQVAHRPAAPPPSAAAVQAEARRLAARGAFRQAVRACFLAVLLRWDETGRLPFDRALTDREMLARAWAADDPALAAQLAPLVEGFDRFWYGGASCSAEEYAAFENVAERAWEAA